MDAERRGDATVQWAVDFVRDKISEEELLEVEEAMITQRVDGEALLLMSASDMQKALQLPFGPAIKLQKALTDEFERESNGAPWELVGNPADADDPPVDVPEEHVHVACEGVPLAFDFGNLFCVIRELQGKATSSTCSAASCLAERYHDTLLPAVRGKLGMLILGVTLCAPIWLWEVSHQKDLCGRLHQCSSMSDETLANYSAVSDSLQAVVGVKDYLAPAQWWDSNRFRANLWAGPGVSCFESLPTVVGSCLQKAQLAQEGCHDRLDVPCAFALAARRERVAESVDAKAPAIPGMETLRGLHAKNVGKLSQVGHRLLGELKSSKSWADVDLASIFQNLESMGRFCTEAQNSKFHELNDLTSNLTTAVAAVDLDVPGAIDDLLHSLKTLTRPRDRGLSDVGAVLDRAVDQKQDLKVAARYARWSVHLCQGLRNFTFQADPVPTLMFVIAKGHLEKHLGDCKLPQAAAAGSFVKESLLTREGLQQIKKVLDETGGWVAWLQGRDSNTLKCSVETYIRGGLAPQASFERLDASRMAADELGGHVPRELHQEVTKKSDASWSHSLQPIKALIDNLDRGCSFALPQEGQHSFAEALRYTWYRSNFPGRPQQLQGEMASLEKALVGHADWFEAQMKQHNETIPMKVKDLKNDLSAARNCMASFLPYYFLLVEDGDLCGDVCREPIQKLKTIMVERFGQSATAAPIHRKLSRLGLPATQACDCVAVDAAGIDMAHGFEDSPQLSSELTERRAKVRQRQQGALDFLKTQCSSAACKDVESQGRYLFSEHVHDLFREIPLKVTSALNRGLYDDVSAILHISQESSSLVIQPTLDVSSMEKSTKEAILAHAEAIAGDAILHYENRHFRSLQKALAAMTLIRKNFARISGIPEHVDQTWDELRKRILKYIREIHDSCQEKVKKRSSEDAELYAVADGIIDLGLVAFEVESFKKEVSKWISSLLVIASSGDVGVGYLLRLGQLLMNDQEERDSVSDGTMSRSTAARRVASEFKQFQNVQNMFWNKAVEKMQKDPEECVQEMKLKAVDHGQELPLNRDELKDGLNRFWGKYHVLQNLSLAREIQLMDLPSMCLQEIAQLRSALNDTKQELEPLLIKEWLPELLAYVFVHYSITATGDDYVSHLQKSMGNEHFPSLLGGMKTPHNIQVLAVLRFFGYGQDGKDLANQLVQVETGGGKSLILGAAATMFALLGFPVRVVCYSDYLSSRDALEFNRTMSDFAVAQVKYSKITTFSEDMVARKGDIRSLTRDLVTARPLKPAPQGLVRANQVLLVDEVDVFMGPDFIGKTHDQVQGVEDPNVRKILEDLWVRRNEARSLQSTRQLCRAVRASSHYKDLLSKFQAFKAVIEMQVTLMCFDLHDYLRREPPMPEVHAQQGCIGYKVQDRIDCDAVFGYKTAFAYLENQKRFEAAEKNLDDHLSLLIPCGQFSYTNIKPKYIFGVSGTVEQLQPFQRQEVQKHGFQVFTTVPSVYGQSKFRFLQQEDAIKVVPREEFQQAIGIAIQEKVKEGRAIIVFFQDEAQLQRFRKSSFAAKLPVLDILTEKLSFDEKAHIIKKAANTGQVTLATSAFGRGSDFVSYDEKLQQNGGVHVLQTFVPADSSEEVQFQGRTARQGKKGTYSLILAADDLQADLGLGLNLLDDGQSKGYERIREARDRKQAERFAEKASEVQEAQAMDDLSHAYFDQLLAGRRPEAAKAYQDMVKRMRDQQGTSQMLSAGHHYIVCLDESGSMSGIPFAAATAAVQSFAAQAAHWNQGTGSAISLIMFNHQARILCDQLPLDKHSACTSTITHSGGGTDFADPLEHSVALVRRNKDRFEKQVILLYTDGHADYPGAQVESIIHLRQELNGNLDFFAITEGQGTCLEDMCMKLYPSSPLSEHCLSQIGPERISTAFQETLRRINMAYVKPQ